LESRHPRLAADANLHGATGAKRSDAARAATATASTASPNVVAVGSSGASIGSRSWANTVNHTRTASALTANRRNQPRAVDAGTPAAIAARRMPDPRRLSHQRRPDHLDQITAP
jgi:hypothetical protein